MHSAIWKLELREFENGPSWRYIYLIRHKNCVIGQNTVTRWSAEGGIKMSFLATICVHDIYSSTPKLGDQFGWMSIDENYISIFISQIKIERNVNRISSQ